MYTIGSGDIVIHTFLALHHLVVYSFLWLCQSYSWLNFIICMESSDDNMCLFYARAQARFGYKALTRACSSALLHCTKTLRSQLSRIGRETHTFDVSVTPNQSTHALLRNLTRLNICTSMKAYKDMETTSNPTESL